MRHTITFILLLVVVALAHKASAESGASDIHQSTTPPLEARFEVVQSQLAAKWTFRLDPHTGRVSQSFPPQSDSVSRDVTLDP